MLENSPESTISSESMLSSERIAELNNLAKDIYKDKVFTSLHVPPEQIEQYLSSIFLPIALGGTKNLPLDDVGMIYECYNKALPRSINGYPIFMSFHWLTKEETRLVITKYREIKNLMESV